MSAGTTPTHTPTTAKRAAGLRAWLTPPVVVLVGGLLVFGALGLAAVAPWTPWPKPLRWALAMLFLLTASARLGPRRVHLEAMVPSFLPRPRLLVALTGALEALGALGLLLPGTAPAAGWCLAILLVVMFPANVLAAQADPRPGRPSATPLGIRTTQQVAFVACAVLSAK